MTAIRFFVTGTPKAQPRIKAGRRGAFTRVYTPDTADDWKGLVAIAAKKLLPETPLESPLRVDLRFYFPRPKAHLRANGALKPNAPHWHTAKPDRDNLDKCILDCLKTIGMYKDDAQVCSGYITKVYAGPGQAPGVAISIEAVPL